MKLTKNIFITPRNEWSQLLILKEIKWTSFTILMIYIENDKYLGGIDFEFMILGIGFAIRYNNNLEESEGGKVITKYLEDNK
jgi:hypothetical protein